jgi:hypothetical protein
VPKSVNNSTKKQAKRLGRPESVQSQKLRERYAALKLFLESNWGRIGLELQRVRKASDVRTALRIVPGVEWCLPFREYPTRCLLAEGKSDTRSHEIRATRGRLKEAIAEERHILEEFGKVSQRASEVTAAVYAAITSFGDALGYFRFFEIVFLIAKELRFEEFNAELLRLDATRQRAHERRQELESLLLSQEACFAQNEVVKFVKSDRREKTAMNFARAMAGLPDYGWVHSFRRCSAFQDESLSYVNLNHQLFELIQRIVKKMKRVNLEKTRSMLKNELLRDTTMLKSYIEPNWHWMAMAFTECRGQNFHRAELPYRIMARFLHHSERSKTSLDIELAKRDKFVND